MEGHGPSLREGGGGKAEVRDHRRGTVERNALAAEPERHETFEAGVPGEQFPDEYDTEEHEDIRPPDDGKGLLGRRRSALVPSEGYQEVEEESEESPEDQQQDEVGRKEDPECRHESEEGVKVVAPQALGALHVLQRVDDHKNEEQGSKAGAEK